MPRVCQHSSNRVPRFLLSAGYPATRSLRQRHAPAAVWKEGIGRPGRTAGRHGRNDRGGRHGVPVRTPPSGGSGRDLDDGDDRKSGQRGLGSDGLADRPTSLAAARFDPAESLAGSPVRIRLRMCRCSSSNFTGRRLGLVPSGRTGRCCDRGALAAAGEAAIAPSYPFGLTANEAGAASSGIFEYIVTSS